MKIYIIEDDNQKAKSIEDFLVAKELSSSITRFSSYQSGLKGIVKCPPDIVLLDMTLPTFDKTPLIRDGRPRSLGGRDIMHKIFHKNIATKVIVISQLVSFREESGEVTLDRLSQQCAEQFPDFFLGSVQYSHTSDQWMSNLIDIFESLNEK